MAIRMNFDTTPPRRRTDAEILLDALRYPWIGDALLTNGVLAVAHVLALYVPVIGPLLQLVVLVAAYRYALEIMTASGQGRAAPPQGWMLTDAGLQRSHLWLQALVLIGVLLASRWLSLPQTLLLVAVVAMLLPGALLALAAAQNLLAAINPMAWLAVARIVGPGYLLLGGFAFFTLMLQLAGGRLFFAIRPVVLGELLFFLVFHAALFALFRLIGIRLHLHGRELGLEQASVARPQLVRERERQTLDFDAREALALEDPIARATALAPLLKRGGAADELHTEYRRCLRQAGDLAGLQQHAEVRVCELLVLAQPKAALALAVEALADRPDFALPDAESSTALLDAAEAAGQLRQATAIAANYRLRHPRRRDSLALARRAAILLADRLGDAKGAEALLVDAATLAADGPEAPEFERLLRRLRAGIALTEGALNSNPRQA